MHPGPHPEFLSLPDTSHRFSVLPKASWFLPSLFFIVFPKILRQICLPVKYCLYRANRHFYHRFVRFFRRQVLHPQSGLAQDFHHTVLASPCQPNKFIGNPCNHWYQKNTYDNSPQWGLHADKQKQHHTD